MTPCQLSYRYTSTICTSMNSRLSLENGRRVPHCLWLQKVKFVISDVAAQWDKTDIPHELSERSRKDRVGRVITRIKKLKGRDEKILEGFENLCDLAQCKCTDHCNCVLEDQVPSAWKEFLADQRR